MNFAAQAVAAAPVTVAAHGTRLGMFAIALAAMSMADAW
jgi:hypothetical protein